MILSLNDITNSPTNDISLFSRRDINENYFYTAMSFINEYHSNIIDAKKSLYRSISEGQSLESINESFQSFYEKVSAIIDKIVKFIKAIVTRFIIGLNKFIKSDKYLRNHLSDLSDFKSGNGFTIKGYKFTFDNNIPSNKIFAEFNKEFIGLDFSKIIREKNKALEYIANAKTKVLKYDYNKLRKEVINGKYDISESEYPNELFEIFRDGVSKKFPIDIGVEQVTMSRKRYLEYNDVSKSVRNKKNDIEKEYTLVKKSLDKLVKKNDDGDLEAMLLDPDEYYTDDKPANISKLSEDAKEKINLFIKTKIDQVTKISDIHTLAFTAKLQALKDCFKQDKNILYTALSKIQSNAYKKITEETDGIDPLECFFFFEQQKSNNTELAMIVQEAKLMINNENTIENMTVINESLVDSVKAGILKIVQTIGTIWRKFTETLNSLFNINKKNYLDKYKDIILNKQLNPDNNYSMYDYPTALKSVLNNATFPQFNYDAMKDHLGSQTDFVKQYLNHFAPNFNEEDTNNNNLRTALIATFRGSPEEKEIPASQLNMTDIYNYCYNYNEIVQVVQKDLTTIQNGAKAGLKLLDNTVSQNQSNSNNANQNTPPPVNNNQNNTQQSAQSVGNTGGNKSVAHPESYVFNPIKKQYYSSLYEQYITEKFAISNNSSQPGALKKTFASNGSNTNTAQTNPSTPASSDNAIKNVANTGDDKQISEIKNQIDNYLKVASIFLNAKKDVYLEIYKVYMIIIKNHIRENLKNAGKGNTTGDQTAQSGSNYQAGNNDQAVDNAINGKQ